MIGSIGVYDMSANSCVSTLYLLTADLLAGSEGTKWPPFGECFPVHS